MLRGRSSPTLWTWRLVPEEQQATGLTDLRNRLKE